MFPNRKPSLAPLCLAGGAIVKGPQIDAAKVDVAGPEVNGPCLTPRQMDWLSRLSDEEVKDLHVFASLSHGRHRQDLVAHPTSDHWRKFARSQIFAKDDANEGHLRIVVSWPPATTVRGRPACRTFPDCPHPGCLALLDCMRVSARKLLESDTPMSPDMRLLCVAIVSKTLTAHHRVMASRANEEMGGA